MLCGDANRPGCAFARKAADPDLASKHFWLEKKKQGPDHCTAQWQKLTLLYGASPAVFPVRDSVSSLYLQWARDCSVLLMYGSGGFSESYRDRTEGSTANHDVVPDTFWLT